MILWLKLSPCLRFLSCLVSQIDGVYVCIPAGIKCNEHSDTFRRFRPCRGRLDRVVGPEATQGAPESHQSAKTQCVSYLVGIPLQTDSKADQGTRKLHARLAVLLPDRQGAASPRDPVESGGIRPVWDINPAGLVFANTGLSVSEWNILMYGMIQATQKHQSRLISSQAS